MLNLACFLIQEIIVTVKLFENPFRPGAGHRPPYLAGRAAELGKMKKHLEQRIVSQNIILTGLRGVGKTVLLEAFKPVAIDEGWLWAGSDMSESASVTEETLATRIMTDLAVVTSSFVAVEKRNLPVGFTSSEKTGQIPLSFGILKSLYDATPGLVSDKLKTVVEYAWKSLPDSFSGLVFAYDEAQNMGDHAEKGQYPLSLLLELFQSLQRKEIPVMLVLTGLPTLFPKLVEARTYAERMFHVILLGRLDEEASREAIIRPVEDANCPVKFSGETVSAISRLSAGYPYFIQFFCREVYDVWIAKMRLGENPTVQGQDILFKLDTDFFQGSWAKATNRQRELLHVIAHLENADGEFTVQEIANLAKERLAKPFSTSHINQMMTALSLQGLVFRNRFGKYSFAVPLLSQFIKRQAA